MCGGGIWERALVEHKRAIGPQIITEVGYESEVTAIAIETISPIALCRLSEVCWPNLEVMARYLMPPASSSYRHGRSQRELLLIHHCHQVTLPHEQTVFRLVFISDIEVRSIVKGLVATGVVKLPSATPRVAPTQKVEP